MEDVFPCGVPLDYRLSGLTLNLPSYVQRRQRWKKDRQRLVLGAISALNALACSPVDLRLAGVRQKQNMSQAQLSVFRRVCKRVREFGRCPHDLTLFGAHLALLKASSLYDAESACAVRPFCKEKLKLLHGTVVAKDIESLAPAHVVQQLGQSLDRPSAELENEPYIKPYWDPLLDPGVLENRSRLVDLLRELSARGLVGAHTRRKTDASLFFVDKKGEHIRMIVDARQANQCMRQPPHSVLSSPSSLAELRSRGTIYSATIDLKDGFHQFRCQHLGSYFCFPLLLSAAELGVETVYDDVAGMVREVGKEELIWPCYDGMPMGWTWALWACHETIKDVVQAADGVDVVPCVEGSGRLTLRKGVVAAAPYVDNINLLGVDSSEVQFKLESVIAELDSRGLAWHDRHDSSTLGEMLGV
eukprot:6481099-Amphidinium_carterae.2